MSILAFFRKASKTSVPLFRTATLVPANTLKEVRLARQSRALYAGVPLCAPGDYDLDIVEQPRPG
jgi:hypothetical protein